MALSFMTWSASRSSRNSRDMALRMMRSASVSRRSISWQVCRMALALSMLEMQANDDLDPGAAGQARRWPVAVRFGGDALDVVEGGALGDVLDGVEDVIHGIDEAVDLIAIEGEWHLEALVEPGRRSRG